MESFEILNNRGVTAPLGILAGSARGGIKTQGDDVAFVLAPAGSTCAALFTSNQVKAAPVHLSARHLAGGRARAVVVNAGNANCCTGTRGDENAARMVELAAQKFGLDSEEILVCSTGIIGHQLPMEKVADAITNIELGARDENQDEKVARAFMTTDTVPKYFAASTEIDGKTVTIGGQTKGVGMIGPDLKPLNAPLHATMLAFITTDAKIEAGRLQQLLEKSVARSFNSVTVDGDTSTNDTAILLASGESGIEITDENQTRFLELLSFVTRELAKKIARDGEGATKLIEITVAGTQTEADAKKIALTIANSPLVKTAIYGRDPNWGRIAMAAGRSGVEFDPKDLSFSLGDVLLFQKGQPVDFDLKQAEAQLEHENVFINLDFGMSDVSWTAWTCDFSYDYVKINAEYHT
jgi:glutamate N-acetyltransferase/amino-acid N-acetyltransferase